MWAQPTNLDEFIPITHHRNKSYKLEEIGISVGHKMVSHFTKFRSIHFTETRVTNSPRFYSNNIFSVYAKFLKKLSSISITFLKTKLTLPI